MIGFRKLMLKKEGMMSADGLKHWSPPMRKKLNRIVYRNVGVRHCPLSAFEERQLFAKWIYENFGSGKFHIFTWRMKKDRNNKTRMTPFWLACIEIQPIGESYVPHFHEMTRLSKQRWFEPSKKKKNAIDKQ